MVTGYLPKKGYFTRVNSLPIPGRSYYKEKNPDTGNGPRQITQGYNRKKKYSQENDTFIGQANYSTGTTIKYQVTDHVPDGVVPTTTGKLTTASRKTQT